MTADCFSDLPIDVLRLVGDELRPRDLKSLSLVSKKIHEAFAKPLWSRVIVQLHHHFELPYLKVPPPTSPPSLSAMWHTTDLRLHSEIYGWTQTRCPHHLVDRRPRFDYQQTGAFPSVPVRLSDGLYRTLEAFTRLAETVLVPIPEKQLSAFRYWYPLQYLTVARDIVDGKEQLGPRHLLVARFLLRSLRLTTDYTCKHVRDAPDLSPFSQLESFSWRAPTIGDFDPLRHVIRQNCTNLRHLEIDLVSDCRFQSAQGPSIGPDCDGQWHFDTELLTPPPSSHPLCAPMLSNLHTLKLTSAPLSSSQIQIIDIRTLRSLILRKCTGWQDFLRNVLDFGVPTRLKSLEIQEKTDACTPVCRVLREPSNPLGSTLARFLGAFGGLEDLFLGLKGPIGFNVLTNAHRHQNTLRRLVLQQRGIGGSVGDKDLIRPVLDVPLLPVDPHVPDDAWIDPSRNPLVGLNLYSIGLTCASEFMETLLLPFCSESSSLELVHIRQSGRDLMYHGVGSYAMDPDTRRRHGRIQVSAVSDLRDDFLYFAMWLFGPHGIASVKALAFGDFACGFLYNRQWPGHNFVMLRNDCALPKPPFSFLNLTSEHGRDFVDRHRRVLEACPTDQLIRPYRPI
ncbi:AAA family ATPase [Tolypocladium capitatum]|uniref:AAA family ATPase n=1 Tax=Tolypocladium capitatum TaxID=45235 RepID=A0A2K3QD98_9HYPO|nr:AAA family ATPase [Tolypocladium capitatum]